MKEDWTEQLRRKLEGHEMPPPDGLWESISKQMDKTFGLKPLSRLTGTAQRWWAVAAIVLALVGFFTYYNSNDNEQPLQANAVPQQQVSEQPANQPSNEQSLSEQPSAHHQTIAIIHHHKQEATLVEEQQPSEVDQQPTEAELHEDQSTEQEQKSDPRTPAVPVIPVTPETPDTYKTPSPQKKWSLGINASGGLLAANTSQRVDRLYYKSADFHFGGSNYNYAEIVASSYSLTEYESKHHLPLRFGLSLQYQLNDRLSLLSGINYTYLYSEFSIPLYQSANYDQKLHYLGLPIGLSWRLLTASRFHLYLAGGMMLEKCLNEKPWQWSVNGSAGAEYAITSLLGVYLEPSLGYYFSDGTQFEHYYKEHPLAPSIEFGLRLHVGE
jgi:hypothetical protein